jgi:hypothetical protein
LCLDEMDLPTTVTDKTEDAIESILSSSTYLTDIDNDDRALIKFAFEKEEEFDNEKINDFVSTINTKADLFTHSMKVHYMKQMMSLADKITLIEDVLTRRTYTADTDELITLHKEYRTHYDGLYKLLQNENPELKLPPVNPTNVYNLHQHNTQVNLDKKPNENLAEIKDSRLSLQKVNAILEAVLNKAKPIRNDK